MWHRPEVTKDVSDSSQGCVVLSVGALVSTGDVPYARNIAHKTHTIRETFRIVPNPYPCQGLAHIKLREPKQRAQSS